jgi:hypothetical protein
MAESTSRKWGLVAWSGITLHAPEDWNIGAIGGDQKQGYLRVDGPDMPRIEVKWAAADHSNFVDVSAIVDKYLREMQRGKKGKQTEVSRDVKLGTRRKARHKRGLECFAWKAETQGFGAGWFCPDCAKTVIIQVMGTLQEPVPKLAEQIILDLEDHPRDDYLTWSTYGFSCQTPGRFKLTGQKLMAGLIELHLEADGERLHLARWGMANVALKGTTLRDWGQKELGSRLKRFTTEVGETEYRGHECLVVSGRTNLPQEKLSSFVQHCMGKPFPDRLQAYLWHCPEQNKILYVEGILDRDNLALLDEVRDRMPCHGADAEVGAPGGDSED